MNSYEETLLKRMQFEQPFNIMDKVAHTRARKALERVRDEQNGEEVLLGHAIELGAKEGDALGKLVRYERSLERSLYRALEELRQLQDRRRNHPSPSISHAITLD
jgi:hypothetical protein